MRKTASGFLRSECDPLARIMAVEVVRTAARLQTRLAIMRCQMWRRECGCRPIQKARRRFPGAGSEILAMMTLCQ
jgi:hypothetical protein